MIKKFYHTLIFTIFITSISLRSEEIKIIYSSSLTGNLYSCICGLKLSVGLAKRDSFFKIKGIDPMKDILLDTGNSLDVKTSTDKAIAIYESFSKIGYHSLGIGANDLQENTISLFSNNLFPLHSENLFQRGFFKTNKFGNPVVYLQRGEITFGIINLSSPSIVYNLSPEIKEKFLLKDISTIVNNLTSLPGSLVTHWIISIHGSKAEAFKIASINKDFIVIQGGELDKKSNKNSKGYSEVDGIKVYSTDDLIGDKIGQIILALEGKRLKIKSVELFEMNVNNLTDSEDILSIMKKHNIKPE